MVGLNIIHSCEIQNYITKIQADKAMISFYHFNPGKTINSLNRNGLLRGNEAEKQNRKDREV